MSPILGLGIYVHQWELHPLTPTKPNMVSPNSLVDPTVLSLGTTVCAGAGLGFSFLCSLLLVNKDASPGDRVYFHCYMYSRLNFFGLTASLFGKYFVPVGTTVDSVLFWLPFLVYIFKPHYFPCALLQINFRCKPSFRESGSRNIREVSSGNVFVVESSGIFILLKCQDVSDCYHHDVLSWRGPNVLKSFQLGFEKERLCDYYVFSPLQCVITGCTGDGKKANANNVGRWVAAGQHFDVCLLQLMWLEFP